MNDALTITATVAAWLPGHYSLSDLEARIAKGDHERVVNMLALWGSPDAEKFGEGYTRIGDATVSIELKPRDELTRAAIQTLQEQLNAERAEWLRKQQAILAEISKLQAITCEVSQ